MGKQVISWRGVHLVLSSPTPTLLVVGMDCIGKNVKIFHDDGQSVVCKEGRYLFDNETFIFIHTHGKDMGIPKKDIKRMELIP